MNIVQRITAALAGPKAKLEELESRVLSGVAELNEDQKAGVLDLLDELDDTVQIAKEEIFGHIHPSAQEPEPTTPPADDAQSQQPASTEPAVLAAEPESAVDQHDA